MDEVVQRSRGGLDAGCWCGCAAVLRECCSAAVQSNEMGNALVRCLGRQSPRASQCKSQLG
jgi:hypothetical protein